MREEIFKLIENERIYQDGLWGNEFDDKNTANDWVSFICRYASNASEFDLNAENFERNMIKVAALAVASVEASKRNNGPAFRHYDKRDCRPAVEEEQKLAGFPIRWSFEDLPVIDDLILYDISSEKFRNYITSGVGTYEITNPIGLYLCPGGDTHRVVDSLGVCHCIAYPNDGKTVVQWVGKDDSIPVKL